MIREFFKRIFGKPKEVMSFRQGFDLTELAIVTFYQKDKKLNFLLDSGASKSTIDIGVIDSIEHTPSKTISTIMGIEGNKQMVRSCIVKLTYKDTDYMCDCLVFDMSKMLQEIKVSSGVIIHGVLGTEFFNKYKYVLDFDELIAYSKL